MKRYKSDTKLVTRMLRAYNVRPRICTMLREASGIWTAFDQDNHPVGFFGDDFIEAVVSMVERRKADAPGHSPGHFGWISKTLGTPEKNKVKRNRIGVKRKVVARKLESDAERRQFLGLLGDVRTQ